MDHPAEECTPEQLNRHRRTAQRDVRRNGRLNAYLDASAVVPRFLYEDASPAVDNFYYCWTGDLSMTEFGASEVASAVSRMWRMGHLGRDSAAEALADFDTFRTNAVKTLELTSADLAVAHLYVRRFELKLRTPDAIHLAVAQRLGATLVTLDKKLVRAADVLGIEVEQPSR